MCQQLLIVGYTGRDKLGNASFDYLFCKLGIFELVADRNLITAPYQLRQICIYGMVRESGKIYRRGITVETTYT